MTVAEKPTKENESKCIEGLGESLYEELKNNKDITAKDILFCAEYLTNKLNQTRAYLKVFYDNDESKYNSAHVLANRLLQKVTIKKAIGVVLDEWLMAKKTKLEKMIIDQLYMRAFYETSKFITKIGTPAFKELKDLGKWQCCIEGITTKYIGTANKPSIEITLADRDKARAELSKYIELCKGPEVQVGLTDESVKNLAKVFKGIVK